MAKIVHSELAPEGVVRYSLGSAEFELGAGGDYETTDRDVLSNAESHPWLAVEYDEEEVVQGEYFESSVRPEDDALSAQNSIANDPDEVRKVEAEKRGDEADRVAIDAGQDQGEVVEGPHGTAYTAAADKDFDSYNDGEDE